jgi:hypothetical protein
MICGRARVKNDADGVTVTDRGMAHFSRVIQPGPPHPKKIRKNSDWRGLSPAGRRL